MVLFRPCLEKLERRRLLATLVVTSLLDTDDGVCDVNHCSLREALNIANGSSVKDEIKFALPGEKPHVIELASALPRITAPISIDGTSQRGYDLSPIVELDGTSAGEDANGLRVSGGQSEVKGLAIYGFSSYGIRVDNNDASTISGNFIGIDGLGNVRGNQEGLLVFASSNNRIGGLQEADRNIVSGNLDDGISVFGDGTDGNEIQGNWVGLGIDGMTPMGNADDGIVIADGPQNTLVSANLIGGNGGDGVAIFNENTSGSSVQGNQIGIAANGQNVGNQGSGIILGLDTTGHTLTSNEIYFNERYGVHLWGAHQNTIGRSSEGNTIAGNNRSGVALERTSVDNEIQGNRIGVTEEGLQQGNRWFGIHVFDASSSNLIGGPGVGDGNTVEFNPLGGISMVTYPGITDAIAGTGNRVQRNSTYGNFGLGIDIGVAGTTANDSGDGDTGANNLQNKPVLQGSGFANNVLSINGILNSSASTNYEVEFYRSGKEAGIGDARFYLGSADVTTDGSGNAAFEAEFAAGVEVVGEMISATVTDTSGNTSEISLPVRARRQDLPLVRILDSGVVEGDETNSVAEFEVILSQVHASVVSVEFETFSGSAIEGQDFVGHSGTLQFQPGETKKTVSVSVLADESDETDEEFGVRLLNPQNGTILDQESIGRILDDDQPRSSLPFGADAQDISELLVGKVHVTLVFIESNGVADEEKEDWTQAEIERQIGWIEEGLQWWQDVFDSLDSKHHLEFEIDDHHAWNPIDSDYEFAHRSSADQRELLYQQLLDFYGADTPNHNFPDLRELMNQRRLETGSDWAVPLFVLDNSSSRADLSEIDGGFARTSVIKTSTNFFPSTVAHEFAHIFYAPDEYPDSQTQASTNFYTYRSGYYDTQNLNAFDGHPDPDSRVPSIMNEESSFAFENGLVSPSALAMMGIQDSDGDGVFDALDLPLTLDLVATYDDGSLHVVGQSAVTTLENKNPHGLGNSLTINRVVGLEASINGGPWNLVTAYDAPQVVIDAALNVEPGDHVRIRTIAQFEGVASPTVEFSVPELMLELSANSISENGGATSVSITRTGSVSSELVVSLASSDTGELTLPTAVTIPAGSAQVTVQAVAVDDLLIDGSQIVVLSASAPGYGTTTANVEVTDDDVLARLDLQFSKTSISENGGELTATVSRNTPPTSDLVVDLQASLSDEVGLPSQVVIPQGSASTTFRITGNDDLIADGDQTVFVTSSAVGFENASATLVVEDDETASLTMEINVESIEEFEGRAQGTVTRNSDTLTELVVLLVSHDESEATVPDQVVIPAGETFVTFEIQSVDDDVVDGRQNVSITGSAEDHLAGSTILGVLDDDVPTLRLQIDRESVEEKGGVAQASVSRNTSTEQPLVVAIVSSDTGEAIVANSIVIESGAASASFSITAEQDFLVDGTQQVVVSVSAIGFQEASEMLSVIDSDVPALLLDLASNEVSENGGTVEATVARNTSVDSALTVLLTSSDVNEATLPLQVTIPAGARSAGFTITGIDDTDVDGNKPIQVTATAEEYLSATASLEVIDDEVAGLSVSVDRASISESAGTARVTVSRNSDLSTQLVVNLGFDPEDTVLAPNAIVIPSGAASTSFSISAIDNNLLDGDRILQLTATADGFEPSSENVLIVDDELAKVTLTLDREAVEENGGALSATVSRNSDVSFELLVSLSSILPDRLSMPASVTIAAGATETTFEVLAVDNELIEGDVSLSLTANADGHQPDSASFVVTENDFWSWTNLSNPFDVNDDRSVSAVDALLVINFLNSGPDPEFPNSTVRPPHFYDVSNDGFASAVDALKVINELNSPSAGEGEFSSFDAEDLVRGRARFALVDAFFVEEEDALERAWSVDWIGNSA